MLCRSNIQILWDTGYAASCCTRQRRGRFERGRCSVAHWLDWRVDQGFKVRALHIWLVRASLVMWLLVAAFQQLRRHQFARFLCSLPGVSYDGLRAAQELLSPESQSEKAPKLPPPESVRDVTMLQAGYGSPPVSTPGEGEQFENSSGTVHQHGSRA